MLKFNLKSILAFILLGVTIFTFQKSHGAMPEYIFVTIIIILFWYLLGLQLALSNIRNILLITLSFALLLIVFRFIFPIKEPFATMGMLQDYDLNPAKIALMKENHDIALEIHLEKSPTLKDRYLKMGDLLFTADGLHYSSKRQDLDLSKLPKTVEWINANLNSNNLDVDVDKIKEWYTKSMIYSLSPGLILSSTPLDQFLFEKKVGFCEHFAASLSSILRIKGYQSRVSYGYAGGSWNPLLKILSFENADAHAWVEVLNPKTNRYQIIDPTNWIFPEVSAGRMIQTNLFWFLIGSLSICCLFSFFLIRRTGTIEKLFQKVGTLEQKYNLNSKGLTLSDRITRLAAIDLQAKENMFKSLTYYLKTYSLDKIDRNLELSLRKSLKKW